MATGLSTQLVGQVGEHLVTAELGRRGIIATPFAGNVPDIDILAYANGITGHIQVKAIKGTSWQFDIRKFLEVDLLKRRQRVNGLNPTLDRKILCIFVALGEGLGDDDFYVFHWGWLQDHFHRIYKGRKEPKNINSFHCAIWKREMQDHKDRWDVVDKQFGITST